MSTLEDEGRGPVPEARPAGSAAREEDSAGHGFDRLGRRLLVPFLLGVGALLLLALIADGRELAARLGEFDLWLLVPVLGLSLVNYLLRFLRWQLYLAALEVTLPRRVSLAVFLVGFVLSITPGKAGELGKAWLTRELGGGAARRTVAAVLGERVTDLVGVLLLIALGALAMPGGRWVAAGCTLAVLAVVLCLSWRGAARRLLALAGRLPWIGPRTAPLEEVYDLLRSLLGPARLTVALGVAVLAWGAEAVGFVVVVRAYEPAAGFLAGIFNYSASTLLGALSMLPGGLVAAEGALTALLDSQGMDVAAAASATLVIRAATLWFAVALGLAALPWVLRRLRRGRADGSGTDSVAL